MVRSLLLLAVCLSLAPATLGQYTPTYAGVSVTRAPLEAANAGTSVQLTADADLSPFPSFIDYPSESVQTTWLVGVAAGYRPTLTSGLAWRAGLETSLVYSAISGSGPAIDVVTGEVGGGYFIPIGSTLGAEVGASALLGFATGTVGTVGSRQGDVFLISPDDGQRYETGSDITATGLGFGLDLAASLVAGPVTASVGYRLATPIDSWEYRVRDVDDASRSSRLPSEGFAANPPSYDLGGLHLRVGVSIPLGTPAPPSSQLAPSEPPVGYIPPEPESVSTTPQEPVVIGGQSGSPQEAEPVRDPLAGVPPPGRERVRWVQSRLNDRGFECGAVDGRVGRNTRACIQAFRRAHGLSDSTEVDNDLLALLNTPR
ncbi:MAG: peptidoglycan-binding domain-containing protein [Bacteroidota bacterium]